MSYSNVPNEERVLDEAHVWATEEEGGIVVRNVWWMLKKRRNISEKEMLNEGRDE